VGLILDTNVLIRADRAGASVDFGPWSSRGDAYISAITASELLVGVHRADSEARRLRRASFVEGVLGAIPVLDFTLEVARTHAEILAVLRGRGEIIGAHDLIIAATALSAGHAVLTSDLNEFRRVPGLEVLAFEQNK
jgi:predicted nucleic acid-binding protein